MDKYENTERHTQAQKIQPHESFLALLSMVDNDEMCQNNMNFTYVFRKKVFRSWH